MQTTLQEITAPPSVWTRGDARWKLIGILAVLLATAICATLPIALASLTVGLVAAYTTRLPMQAWLHRLPGIAGFVALLLVIVPLTTPGEGWGPFSLRGFQLALLLCTKVFAALIWTFVLVATSPFDQLLAAARACGLPGLVAHLLLLVHRYVLLFNEHLGQLRVALRLRAFRNRPNWRSYRTVGQVTGTLLVRSHDRAERVGQALCTRGYQGTFRLLRKFQTQPGDVLFFLGLAATALGLVILDYFGQGG